MAFIRSVLVSMPLWAGLTMVYASPTIGLAPSQQDLQQENLQKDGLRQTDPQHRGPQALRIVAFGSSSTEGAGATAPTATYPAQLQKNLERMLPPGRTVTVINRGIGGEDADDMIKRLPKDVIARHPDVVIWQTGSNDPIRHVPLDRFERETRTGVAAMQSAGIEVILMEPQDCPRLDAIASSADFRASVRKIGEEMHVDVIRRADLMRDWLRHGRLTRNQLLAPDGLHMTDGGYALLAKAVAPTVLEVEEIAPDTPAKAFP